MNALPKPPALETCAARVPFDEPIIGADIMIGSLVLGNHSCSTLPEAMFGLLSVLDLVLTIYSWPM